MRDKRLCRIELEGHEEELGEFYDMEALAEGSPLWEVEEFEEEEEEGEEEGEEEEGGLVDAKLWEGAAAAGWRVQLRSGGARAGFEYLGPDGRLFKSKRSAVKAEAEATRR